LVVQAERNALRHARVGDVVAAARVITRLREELTAALSERDALAQKLSLAETELRGSSGQSAALGNMQCRDFHRRWGRGITGEW
jgi:hypothetical protein